MFFFVCFCFGFLFRGGVLFLDVFVCGCCLLFVYVCVLLVSDVCVSEYQHIYLWLELFLFF